MVELVLTPEQTRLVLGARQNAAPTGLREAIVVVDSEGAAVGQLLPPRDATRHFTTAEIASIEARIGNDGPYLTTAELLDSLSSQS